MYMIQITDEKVTKMSEICNEMLTLGGKLMSCIAEMEEGGEMGERRGGRMGMRGGRYSGNMGGNYGNRYDDENDEYGERRRRY